MPQYHLAQLNIARLSAPIDSPELKGFVDNLDNINALAESAPGFVWRLQTDDGDATAIDYFGKDFIVNMSVWEDLPFLHDYVYRTAHAKIMSRRKEWFSKMTEAYSVLWWSPVGSEPTLKIAESRLLSLRENGPNADAFTFKKPFPHP